MIKTSTIVESETPRLRFRLPLDAARLLRARERIRDYLNLFCSGGEVVDDIVLCVEEACTNVIRHSGSLQAMDVSLRFVGGSLVADVIDHGEGFDVDAFDPATTPDLMSDGGRGLFLIASLMDELVLRADGGVHVHMEKRGLDGARRAPTLDGTVGDIQAADERHRGGRMRALLEEIDEGFLAMDWEYRYVHCNQTALEMLGVRAEDVLGRCYSEVWPELSGTMLDVRYREAMETGQFSVFEDRSPATGTWLEIRVYPTSGGISVYLRGIDERKRIEEERERLFEELRHSERRFRATFEQAAVGVVHFTLDGRYRLVNDRFCELVGYAREELEGASFAKVTHPDDMPAERRLIAAAIAGTGTDYCLDKRYVRKDGSRLWASLTVSLVSDEGGAPDYLVGIVEDIGERKAAIDALQRYQALWEHTRDIMLFVRVSDGRIVEANGAAELAYGYTRDELRGMTVFDIRSGDSPSLIREHLTQASRGGLRFEAEHRRADGTTFPVEVSSRGTVELRGEGDVVLSVVRDITERARFVEALAKDRDALATVMDATSAQIAYLDRDFTFLLVNEAYAQGSGYSRESLVGRRHFDLFPDEENEALFAQVRDTGREYTVRARPFAYRDQPERGVTYWDWRLSPITGPSGAVDGLVLSLVEVTQAVRRSMYAEALSSMLERLGEARDLDEVARAMGDGVCDALGADGWDIWELHGDHWRQRERRSEQDVAREPVPAAQAPLAMIAYETRDVVAVSDCATRAHDDLVCRRFGLRSLMIVPLPFETGSFTAMFFGWVSGSRSLGQAETDFAHRAAATAASAMLNARLFEEAAGRERFSAALSEISAGIASLLDTEQIFMTAVTLAAGALGAESAVICLLQDDSWVPRYGAHLPPEWVDVLIARERLPHADVAVAERRVVAVHDCEADPLFDPDVRRVQNLKSVLVAPIFVRDKATGAVFLNFHSRVHHFTSLEIDFAGRVAAIISAALDTAGVYEAERRVAAALQENFIHPLPEVGGLEFAVAAETANKPELVGGDFHDAFPLNDGRVAVVIGDVEGKGVRAAGLTETVRSAVRTLALVDASPAFILGKVNQLLLEERVEQFVTVAVLVLDPVSGELRYASAGHPPAVLLSALEVGELRSRPGTPLGSFDSSYEELAVRLHPNDIVLLYTDGLSEARHGGEYFGERRMFAVLGAAGRADLGELVRHLRDASVAYGGPVRDDMQIVAFRLTGKGAGVTR